MILFYPDSNAVYGWNWMIGCKGSMVIRLLEASEENPRVVVDRMFNSPLIPLGEAVENCRSIEVDPYAVDDPNVMGVYLARVTGGRLWNSNPWML